MLAALDLLIGSHALSIDADLVTNDRAFGQLAGLRVEDWTEESRWRKARISACGYSPSIHDYYSYHGRRIERAERGVLHMRLYSCL